MRADIDAAHWLTNRAISKLGGSLIALAEYELAAPLLLESFAALDVQRGAILGVAGAGCVSDARGRIFTLYDVWNRPQDAAL